MARIFFAYIAYLRLAVESLRNLQGILSSGNEMGQDGGRGVIVQVTQNRLFQRHRKKSIKRC